MYVSPSRWWWCQRKWWPVNKKKRDFSSGDSRYNSRSSPAQTFALGDLTLGLFVNMWSNEFRAGFGSHVKQQFPSDYHQSRDFSDKRSCPINGSPPTYEMDSAPCPSTLIYPEALQEQQQTVRSISISICFSIPPYISVIGETECYPWEVGVTPLRPTPQLFNSKCSYNSSLSILWPPL